MRLFAKLAVFAGGLILSLFVIVQTGVFDQALFEQTAKSRLNFINDRWSDADGLTVFFCGTGSPLPSEGRSQACVAVIAGDRFFLVDAGTGSWETILQAQFQIDTLAAVFLTHFHSDHIGDLGEANLGSWVGGRSDQLSVYGPTGVESVVAGFNQAFALDDSYRIAHHGEAIASSDTKGIIARPFSTPTSGTETVVWEEDGLRVVAFSVDHGPVEPSVGYRFERDGRSVVITGDTAPSDYVKLAARGADLLVHEAQANHMVSVMEREARASGNARLGQVLEDIQDYHTPPVDAAKIANDADVELLALYHLTPAPDNSIARRLFMKGVSKVRSQGVVVAEDGMTIHLPAEGRYEIIAP